jgi:hypothetical protein
MSTVNGYVKELQRFGLTLDEIKRVFETLRMIYAGQVVGYFGAILGSEFDKNMRSELDILVKLGFVQKTGKVEGLQAYRCSQEGDELGSKIWEQQTRDKENALWSFLGNYPRRLVAFWLKYATVMEKRAMIWRLHSDFSPSEPYIPPGSVVADLLREPEVQEKIRSIWDGLVKVGLAVITIYNVATGGGKLRAPTFVIPEETAKVIRDSAYSQLKIDLKEYHIYNVLMEYSQRERMSRQEFTEELRRRGLTEAEVQRVVENLKKLSLTSGYTTSPLAPFLIKNVEAYRNYLYTKYVQALKDAILSFSISEKEPTEAIEEAVAKMPKQATSEHVIYVGSESQTAQWGVIGISEGKFVRFDLNAPHIVFVCGKMGSGKGYTIGVLCEMLAGGPIQGLSNVSKKATIIVLYNPREDKRSEFWSIKNANNVEREVKILKSTYDVCPQKLVPPEQFRVFVDPFVFEKAADQFKEDYETENVFPLHVDPSPLTGKEWAIVLSAGESVDQLYVKRLFSIIEKRQFGSFDLSTIEEDVLKDSDLTQSQQKLAKQRLGILKNYLAGGESQDFVSNLALGGVNVFDFRKTVRTPDDIFSVMTLIISVLQTKKGLEEEPFVFVINEAHDYFKGGASREFVDSIDYLIRRKRHGNNWLLLDTHFPDDVNSDIIKLSDVKIVHFLDKTASNPILLKAFEGSADKFYELAVGEAIISADQSSEGKFKPITVSIRPRITKHGAPTKTSVRDDESA